MSGFAFPVACLWLVANEPFFGIDAVPGDWPVLRQNLRIVEVNMVFSFEDTRGYSRAAFEFCSLLLVFRVPLGKPRKFLHSIGHWSEGTQLSYSPSCPRNRTTSTLRLQPSAVNASKRKSLLGQVDLQSILSRDFRKVFLTQIICSKRSFSRARVWVRGVCKIGSILILLPIMPNFFNTENQVSVML